MTNAARRLVQLTLAGMAGAGCLLISERFSINEPRSMVSTAEAVIGRPVTPMSYAGVARRTTRRAVTTGAAVAPVVVAPRPVAPAAARRCVQSVDAYGRVIRRCY
jgi:hypothetical protein